MACGTVLFSMFFLAFVSANALYLQDAKHPAPWWSSRNMLVSDSMPVRKRVNTSIVRPPISADGEIADIRKLAVRSDQIHNAQNRLAKLGYYKAHTDGLMGPATRKAVVDFQIANRLSVDGIVDQELILQLDRKLVVDTGSIASFGAGSSASRNGNTESTHSESSPVRQIQAALRKYGNDIAVDGKLGFQTRRAIARFQTDYKLNVTGEPNEELVRKLNEIGVMAGG